MSLLSQLERRFGRYAVPNLTLILIAGQVALYVLNQFSGARGGEGILSRIRLYPARVLEGEVWRLVTFLFDPPTRILLFAIIFWYLFYIMGSALEMSWSAFRYNVFLAIGYFASVAVAFAVHFLGGVADAKATNLFLYGTVFLAFARLFPDFTLYIFFILPVKIKWLAMLQWCFYGLSFVTAATWMERAMIAASVLNYFLFFGREMLRDMKHGRRRIRFRSRVGSTPQRIVHQCRICGLTSDEAPQMQFRYCSRCAGESCYCSEHLHDHEHVDRMPPAGNKS